MSYTLSKSEDTGASAIGGNDYDNEGGGSRYLDLKDKGLSPFDVRHSLVASANWTMPFGRGGSGVRRGAHPRLERRHADSAEGRRSVLGEHRRTAAQSADDRRARLPDLCPGADPNPVLGGPDAVLRSDGVLPAAARRDRQRAAQLRHRSGIRVRGPGGLAQSVPLSGAASVQLRFEVFNLFNRANFASPTAAIFNPDGTYRADAGRITSTVGTPRQMQLGIKFVW